MSKSMIETARRALVCCVLVLSAALYLPLDPEIDTSLVEWQLHPARAENWQYGTEVLTNYGPLGFAGVPFYHPSTWVQSLTLNLLVLLLTVVCLRGYWRALRDDPWPSWLWLFFVLVPSGLAPTREWAPVQALPYVIVLASVFRQFFSPRPTGPIAQCALGVLLAIFLMMKLMFLSIIGLGLMVVTADEVFRRRRFPWTLASLVATGTCIWLLLGQSLWNVPPFIRGALEITRGYREVMPFWDVGSTRLAVLLMLAFLCTGAALYFRARRDLGRWRAWLPTLVWLGAGYLVVLHGFVRPDAWHVAPALLLLPSLAAMLHPLLAVPQAGRQRKLAILPPMAFGLVFFAGVAHLGEAYAFREPARRLVRRLAAPVRLATGWDEGPHRQWTERMMELEEMHPWAPRQGTVDMPLGDPGFLLASPARFRPRPTLAAFHADTPWLARRNQAWLESDKGPDALLFRPCAIDGKYPTLIDNLSFLALSTHYQVVRARWPYAVLERRLRPRTYRLVPLGVVAATQGEPVAVPHAAEGPIWAVIRIRPSPAGRLMTALFKNRPLRIRSTMDKRQAVHRLHARMAAAGFLLSPYLGREGFYRYYNPNRAAADETWWVRTVVVETPPVRDLPLPDPYSRDFTIEFFRVQWEKDS